MGAAETPFVFWVVVDVEGPAGALPETDVEDIGEWSRSEEFDGFKARELKGRG